MQALPSAQTATRSRGPDDFLVVGIGASAGGLDACSRLMDVLPADSGMAFILVQHLDPTHESMMVGLLSEHTKMTVQQAADGMRLAPNHLYVIPPGAYLSVVGNSLVLSRPAARHGTRLPFDFLLNSLADACGARAAGVVLSGTGADGSLGLRAIKQAGGLVIAQDANEAGYGGMPRSAVQTGAVDLVLRVADIPAALARQAQHLAPLQAMAGPDAGEPTPGWLPAIIELLRTRTVHDFSLYKTGTLQRRIERRMAMAGVQAGGIGDYLAMLHNEAGELGLLAKDLLINVTSFFRDPAVFAQLAENIIPDLIRSHAADQPLRIWIAGCSTGEETYSLAMLFREQIALQKSPAKLQFFASDVDPDAVASAREGLYPATIEAEVSAERLARFFVKEDDKYRVLPELRASVVFTVQDVLADPPFSRLDMVTCRNLLIYLRPEAQAKVISLFHFALRPGGILLLGSAETVGAVEGRFEVISKSARTYRHIGRSRPGEFGFLMGIGDGARGRAAAGQARMPAAQTDIAALGRRLLMDSYAPAAILINQRHDCLFLFGPTDRYLRIAPGPPTHDLLAMARPEMRTKLRAAIQLALQQKARIAVPGGRIVRDGQSLSFSIEVQPVTGAGEDLLMVCFVDAPNPVPAGKRNGAGTASAPRVAELERELDATRSELQGAIHDLEMSSEEQKAINEEALSVSEEYQSTNEELLTSKEELQSLNEELTALNSQLQETLERQRTTADDLQNVLYSTDVATLFLGSDLRIRFFTPATRSLFAVLPADIGRPLADLRSLAPDAELSDDAAAVLRGDDPVEREIQTPDGLWFRRRILPYRAHDNRVEGVVITFNDITKRRTASSALEEAKHLAEQATMAKSRFLAAASHDLRQPLQTLALLQGLLSRTVEGEREKKLLVRLDETLNAMSGMLNALLDINQIEAGVVHPEITDFPIALLLDRLRGEFDYHAQAKGLNLRIMPCSLSIASDPRLLEQMIRNLLSNALKYTKQGKVLLGCRRHGATVSIQIWDTGIGIPAAELQAIFEEYHQIDNAARERSLGLGLGLSIVKRLAVLLDHRVRVRSRPGKGSVFAVDVKRAQKTSDPAPKQTPVVPASDDAGGNHRSGKILVVEDDPEVRDLLELFLKDEGHRPVTAPDGPTALEMIAHRALKPDLVFTDYNLPNGWTGLQLAERLREKVGRALPIVVLTGDISTGTLRAVAQHGCVLLNKPVKLQDLSETMARLLPALATEGPAAAKSDAAGPAKVYIVDDDAYVRETIAALIETDGGTPVGFASGEAFLDGYHPGQGDCLLIDASLPGMSGIDLLLSLRDAGHRLPSIMITGNSDVAMAVQAMKAGAAADIEKPIAAADLLASIHRALERSHDSGKVVAWQAAAAAHLAALTPRQRQIMQLVLAGHPSKNIAADLDISQRTVENHRASIMKKTGSASLPALARLALAASWTGDGEPAAA